MPFGLSAWAVDGARTSAQDARLMLETATRRGNGRVRAEGSLIVTEDPAGASDQVRITPGESVVNGAEYTTQGSYYDANVGEDYVTIAGNSTSTDRYDLVVVRVEDPTFSGSPWSHDPTQDPIFYFRVLENQGSTADSMPSGQSGIALARVLVPANTTTPSVTNADITNFLYVANPVTELLQDASQSTGTLGGAGDGLLDSASFEDWPLSAQWSIYIPDWAHAIDVQLTVLGADKQGTGNCWAEFRWVLGDLAADGITGGNLNINAAGVDNQRQTVGASGTAGVPDSMLDTTQTLKLQGRVLDGTGTLGADEGTVTNASVFLKQWAADWIAQL